MCDTYIICTGPSSGSDDSNAIPLIVGAAGGAVVFIILTIMLLCTVVVLVKYFQNKNKDYAVNSNINNLGADVTLKPNPSYGINSTKENSSKDYYDLLPQAHVHNGGISNHSYHLPTVTDEMMSGSDVVKPLDGKTNESQNYYVIDAVTHHSAQNTEDTAYVELIQKAT